LLTSGKKEQRNPAKWELYISPTIQKPKSLLDKQLQLNVQIGQKNFSNIKKEIPAMDSNIIN